jgi:hypothetical protein
MDNNQRKEYKTIEEIAAVTDRSSGTIRNLIKRLGIMKFVFPGDKRERVSPDDVKRIRDEITEQSQSRGSRGPLPPNH